MSGIYSFHGAAMVICTKTHVCSRALNQLQCVFWFLRGPKFCAEVQAEACKLSLQTPAQQSEKKIHHSVSQLLNVSTPDMSIDGACCWILCRRGGLR